MWGWGVGVGGKSNVPRNIDLHVARHVGVAMSHAADCLPTLRKVEDTSPFLATCCETFCCAARDKAGMSNGQFVLGFVCCKFQGMLLVYLSGVAFD